MSDTSLGVEPESRHRSGWRDYVPAGREATVFVLVMFVSAVGLGLFLSGSVLYYTTIVGLSNAQVGTGLSVAAVAGVLFAVPIGAIADRVGARNALVVIMAWRGAWFVALALVDGPVGFVIAAVSLAVAEGATPPTVQSLVGAITQGADRTRTMAIVRTVRNVGLCWARPCGAPGRTGRRGGVPCLGPEHGRCLPHLGDPAHRPTHPAAGDEGLDRAVEGHPRARRLEVPRRRARQRVPRPAHDAPLGGNSLWVVAVTDLPKFLVPWRSS
ncbi:MFS transporter [Oerskovia sp. M15]